MKAPDLAPPELADEWRLRRSTSLRADFEMDRAYLVIVGSLDAIVAHSGEADPIGRVGQKRADGGLCCDQ
jgi:hypothetical protein